MKLNGEFDCRNFTYISHTHILHISECVVLYVDRLERLQRLAEKVHREMKTTDNRLEELERRVEDEARRLDRLHPLEAKHAVDLLEQDIRSTETQIQNIFTDVHTLTEGRYSQAPELHKR